MDGGRRRQIEKLARLVRDSCSAETPLDVKALVECLKGEIVEGSDPDTEAMIRRKGDGFEITLNRANTYEPRNRFSISHELGHLFLHMGYLINEDLWNTFSEEGEGYPETRFFRYGHSVEEYEANAFAAALLMPGDEFTAVVSRHVKEGMCDLEKVAEHFDVSKEAARNRGRFLGIFHGA